MFGDCNCICAWGIRCHDPSCLQRFEIEVVIANTDTLNEAHTRHDGEEASIHFALDNEQDFGFRRVPGKILLTQRTNQIQVGTGRKHWTHTLDKGGWNRVDKQYPGHEQSPSVCMGGQRKCLLSRCEHTFAEIGYSLQRLRYEKK